MIRLYSWNVNGIRSASQKGLFDWIGSSGAHVICLQETKAQPSQLGSEFHRVGEFSPQWSSALKKGYSGVATFSTQEVRKTSLLGDSRFDDEGRVLVSDFGSFVLFNCYFPNSQEAGARLNYKLEFCKVLHERANEYRRQGRTVVLCGDYNIAHTAIDLENPNSNEKNPGYLPEERAWMDGFIEDGWIDTFRYFHKEPKRYSWWSYRTRARERNIGWRLDYFCINSESVQFLAGADIHEAVLGSDHCPVHVDLNLEVDV
jgi:exodeoxyribonuclease-3